MNIVNAPRGSLLPGLPARKPLMLSLLAAFCVLHGGMATAALDTGMQPPDLPAGNGTEQTVTEAVADTLPVTGNAEPGAPVPAVTGPNDNATTLANATLQPGISSILARLQPAIIYVPPTVTDPVDLAILAARKAMQANNLAAFDTAAALVPRGHALSGYLDYWRLRIRLNNAGTPARTAGITAPTTSVDGPSAANGSITASGSTTGTSADAEYQAVSADARAWLGQNPRTLTADLLRRDWMLVAGRRQDWATIDALYPHWTLKDESAPECLMALSAIARTPTGQHPGAATLKAATAQILQPVALNPTCTALLQTLAEHGLITPAQRQQRLNLALEINSPADIREAVQLLPNAPDSKALDVALNRPGSLLGITGGTPGRSAGLRNRSPQARHGSGRTTALERPAPGIILVSTQTPRKPARAAKASKASNQTKAHHTPRAARHTTASRAHAARGSSAAHLTAKQGHARKQGRAVTARQGTPPKLAGAPKQPAITLTPLLAKIALVRLARQDSARAAELLKSGRTANGIPLKLGPADRAFVWSQIAMAGMFRLDGSAPRWADEARHARVSDHTRVWLARAALAEQHWTQLDTIIRAMEPALRNSPTWTYWHGRAQQALGHPRTASHAFQTLATRHDYYGKLAREELGRPHRTVDTGTLAPVSEALVRAVENNDGIRQAMAFYQLGLRGEGNREWNFQMRGRSPEQLRAAATWAARHGLLDRAINTDERIVTSQASPHLRFPTPFAEQLLTITQQQAIDPAWVYGLIRQESRFVMSARSSVGASGLMQIMPATAKWVARQMGNTSYQPDQLNNLDTNLTFGSYYLKRALDDLNGSSVLATAGYNAGPRRAHAWRASLRQPMEGAIFTELIPFTETRGYVKAVLSNTVDYATLFSGQPQSLKRWLATITPEPVGLAQLP